MATTPRTVGAPLEVEVDPISRIEGHLGVKVTIGTDGVITDAKAHGNLWRGFENFLLGRDINDAITYTQRICGVCPVPHGTASMFAADAVLGYSKGHITFKYDGTHGVPDKALLIRNLVLSAEFLMSSITHFYHLAAPSYVQGPQMPPWTPYFNDEYYATQLRSMGEAVPDTSLTSMKLWDAVILSYVKALKIRRKTFEAGALFAGRMPMTSCFVAGGVSNDGTEDLAARCDEFEALIKEVADFVVAEYVPIALALGALYPGFDNGYNHTKPGGELRGYGAGLGRFLSWGMLPNLDDTLTFPGGVAGPGVTEFTVVNKAEVASKFLAGGTNSVPTNLTEDIAFSRYEKYADDAAVYATSAARPYASATSSYPGDVTRTKPVRNNGYTYMKGPRWQGKPCEVGPLARLVVADYYPVDGRTLAAVVPGYTKYVKQVGATTGLDPAMIDAGVAVALVRDGLATLTIGSTVISTLPALSTDIVAAYTHPSAVITGTVAGWVIGLKGGLSTMDRLRARALESFVLAQAMVGSLEKSETLFESDEFAAYTGFSGSQAIEKVGGGYRVYVTSHKSLTDQYDGDVVAYDATDPADRSTYSAGTVVDGSALITALTALGRQVSDMTAVKEASSYTSFVTDSVGAVHICTSTNGITWAYGSEIYAGAPGGGMPLTNPSVVKVGGTYHIWAEDASSVVGNYKLAYASWNGTTFTAPVNMTGLGAAAAWKGSPSVYFDGTDFVMYLVLGGHISFGKIATATPAVIGTTATVMEATATTRFTGIDATASRLAYSVYHPTAPGTSYPWVTSDVVVQYAPAWRGTGWIQQLKAQPNGAGTTWRNKTLPVGTVQNWGATEAPRGALMHQAKITNGKIAAYQCIVPTTWNGSPKDASGGYGAMEAAVIGAPFSADTKVITSANGTAPITTQGGVEVLRIAQSFDPCIACAVH